MKTEPVLTNGTAASIAAAVTPLLVEAGLQSDAAGRYGSFVGAALALVLVIWHLISARSKVTPLAPLLELQAALATPPPPREPFIPPVPEATAPTPVLQPLEAPPTA